MNAAGCRASRSMRVLSPRMLPPVTGLLGSTLNTATRQSAVQSCMPRASMKVLLPAPGTPVMPTRNAPPACGVSRCSRSSAAARCVGARLSTSVMPRASAVRSPARICFTNAAISGIPANRPPPARTADGAGTPATTLVAKPSPPSGGAQSGEVEAMGTARRQATGTTPSFSSTRAAECGTGVPGPKTATAPCS